MNRTRHLCFSTEKHQAAVSSSLLLSLLQIIILVTISNSFHYSYIFNRKSSISKGRHKLLSPFPQSAPSTVLWSSSSPQFQVGEEVMVADDDGATHVIGLVEQKKGGWYTVYLSRDSMRVKRRGSQLQKKSGSTDTQSTIVSSTNYNSVDNDEDEPSSATPADIVDLDSILQSMHQKYTEEDMNFQLSTTNQIISTDTIHQITNCHSQYNQWLIFSDLHVMPSTLSTCLEVLDTIHNTALRANAGILFLGDFWHHRGFVRVDCLNAVLDAMAKWTVPCIMIPGNHDQNDWKGVEHALTPLSNAYRICSPNAVDSNDPPKQYAGPLIITHPTKFLDALFIPHIRDKAMMKSILSSKEAASSTALFVHADVKGASMNDLILSQHGVSASIFPAGKHVYSGHFHKPHVVNTGKNSPNSVSIRYVGSPYQTSFSESGQTKSLLLVDSMKNWQCIEEIPIDIGPRYHRISSAHEFLDSRTAKFRQGDKVAVTACQRELEEMRILAVEEEMTGQKSPFDIKLEELRDAGIAVEIRDGQSRDGTEELFATGESSTSNEKEIELEDLSPKATLAAYLDNEVDSGELGDATAKTLLENGEDLLRESNDVFASKGDTSPSLNSPANEVVVSELELESVSLLGFGSFRQEVVYPLSNRGVVLLRGTNKDFGSDSNGVGKSTLAMSSLWALSGSMDARPTQDWKVTDVVNDFSKIAEVTLCGSLNSKPFLVKRTKSTSSKGSSLTFTLDGSDMTRQSSKDTQTFINEYFSIGSQMLARTIFHGQHTLGGLLESSDAKLKEELSYLVSLEIWQQSASLARSKQRELSRMASELEGMLSLRVGKDKTRAEEKSHAAKETMKNRERVLENERQTLLQKEQSLSLDSGVSDIEKAMDSVQTELHECNTETNGLEEELAKFMGSGNDEINVLRSKLNEKLAPENDARANLQACQRKHDVAMMELKSAERQLGHIQSEWDANTSVQDISSLLSSPETCRSCGQPIISSTAQKHVTDSIKEKLTAANSHVDEAKESFSVAALAHAKAKEDTEARGLEAQSYMKHLREAEETLSLQTDGLRKNIKGARSVQSNLSTEFASLARKAKEMSEFNLIKSSIQANLDRLNEALKSSVVAYEDCCSELEMIEANIAELKREKETLASRASLYALLVNIFGPKGVQAFVLRNVVQALQHCSQTYLDELSDGSLQVRMQVGSNDSIIKQAAVRDHDGTWRVRSLSSLSGGQWRRCSLSLSLGFIDLASKRGKLRSSLLVLDEPLTHLDSAGRKSVGKLLRKMLSQDSGIGETHGSPGFGLSTILVILQEIAAEEIEECFDQIDEVIKHGGESFVILDGNGEE
eukprot:CAMPEP_0172321892 /NCGR_PEP_ID=MMETSP1058-20130122/44578_1 /TAXON_ID=83371 /ORGANISM="Detonula confervacea, Strain CCMP 353" /LENGTH=1334 /DNA_ID=CAMNT_0013037503 /DNA_START=59 /DNA_END=4063 /DNA_ORIENTATION=+